VDEACNRTIYGHTPTKDTLSEELTPVPARHGEHPAHRERPRVWGRHRSDRRPLGRAEPPPTRRPTPTWTWMTASVRSAPSGESSVLPDLGVRSPVSSTEVVPRAAESPVSNFPEEAPTGWARTRQAFYRWKREDPGASARVFSLELKLMAQITRCRHGILGVLYLLSALWVGTTS